MKTAVITLVPVAEEAVDDESYLISQYAKSCAGM
jgi:hypothetical protein